VVDLDKYPTDTQIYKVISVGEHTFSFHSVAEQLIEAAARLYGIQITEIVVDFIKDRAGVEWFIGVKAFRFVPKKQETTIEKLRNAFIEVTTSR